MPRQIVRSGGRLIYRMLLWNPGKGSSSPGGAAERLLAVPRRYHPEVGVRMPESPWAVEPREETGDGAESSAMLHGVGASGSRRYVIKNNT